MWCNFDHLNIFKVKTGIFCLLVVAFISLSSCEKELLDSPGAIPGMGNTTGNLEIKEVYELPYGVFMVNQIIESDSQDITFSKFGSGKNERLKLSLYNSNNTPRTVFFPKGLIFQNSIPGFHNGILLQTTWMNIEPGARRDVIVELFCINSGLLHNNQDSHYNFLGVTDSPTLSRLLDLIGWRKINYEMIYGTFKGSQLVTQSGPAYADITARLQTIVWNLTDIGIDISKEDTKFIESIPKLFPDEIPPVDKASSSYPEYFHEFEVSRN